MRYGSVCSGIEAASLAWHGLGWEPSFFAEVEPFPCAVLMHRWGATRPLRPLDPAEGATEKDRKTRRAWAKATAALPDGGTVPNLGDFTKIKETDYAGDIDLLVGGTPCQSFSIAGLRKGLGDPRGNLCLEFAKLAYRSRARVVVWENVPGVLTSGGGRDFAGFLSLICGWEIPVPKGGWRRCGIVTNAPGCFGVAWRVLDAQYTRVPEFPRAVPQRRRRVILVGHLGSWEYPAKVLLEREMCGGIDPPRREARQGTAGNADGGSDGARALVQFDGLPCWWDGTQKADTLTVKSDQQLMPDKNRLQCVVDMRQVEDQGEGVSPALLRTDNKGGKVICEEVCPTLDANYPAKLNRHDARKLVQEVFAFSSEGSNAMKSPNPEVGIQQIDVAKTLDTTDPSPSKHQGGMAVVEAERTIGFIKNDMGGTNTRGYGVFPTIRADVRPAVAVIALDGDKIAKKERKGGAGLGVSQDGVMYTETVKDVHSVCYGTASRTVVRKLIPLECERLMAMPDGYTRIPWRGKSEEACPDGPRYKALGNSMCVNVMAWIGRRIDAMERTGSPC